MKSELIDFFTAMLGLRDSLRPSVCPVETRLNALWT